MSAKSMGRAWGVVIKCDGTDETFCNERFQTANVIKKVNREAAKKLGWGRGLRPKTKSQDFCPEHMEFERQVVAKQKAEMEANKLAKAEARKAKLEAKAKKTTSSPSADFAPAPST